MLGVAFCNYAKCRYDEHCYAECHDTINRFTKCHIISDDYFEQEKQ
jgi:hypothetical protein